MIHLEACEQCGRLVCPGETITITVAAYEALKTAASAESVKQISMYRARSRSAIARNPDLAEFILKSAVTMTIAEITAKVRSELGERAPSRSSIYRFVEAMKRGR